MEEELISVRNSYSKLFEWTLGLVSFLIVALPKLSAVGLVLLFIATLVLYVKKQATWRLNWTASFLILLYFAYIVGIVFSHDKADGLRYAEYKMGLFLIPLILAVKPKFSFSLRVSFMGLIAGILVAVTFGLINSIECYSETPSFMGCFTSSRFSSVHHPSYFSAFVLFSGIGFFYGMRQRWKGFTLKNFIIYLILAIPTYFLCLSLAGISFLGLTFVAVALYFIFKNIGLKWGIPASIIVVLLPIFIISNTPGLKVEIEEAKKSYKVYFSDPQAFLKSKSNGVYCKGSDIRLIMWTISTEIVLEHPFGVGTGNTDEYLEEKLRKYGINHLIEYEFNPHNQYLQTMIETGIVGLLLFIMVIFTALWYGWKHRSYLMIILVAGFAFNCLFESMLQRQSGVVFYTFWICLLLLSMMNHSQYQSKTKLSE